MNFNPDRGIESVDVAEQGDLFTSASFSWHLKPEASVEVYWFTSALNTLSGFNLTTKWR